MQTQCIFLGESDLPAPKSHAEAIDLSLKKRNSREPGTVPAGIVQGGGPCCLHTHQNVFNR